MAKKQDDSDASFYEWCNSELVSNSGMLKRNTATGYADAEGQLGEVGRDGVFFGRGGLKSFGIAIMPRLKLTNSVLPGCKDQARRRLFHPLSISGTSISVRFSCSAF